MTVFRAGKRASMPLVWQTITANNRIGLRKRNYQRRNMIIIWTWLQCLYTTPQMASALQQAIIKCDLHRVARRKIIHACRFDGFARNPSSINSETEHTQPIYMLNGIHVIKLPTMCWLADLWSDSDFFCLPPSITTFASICFYFIWMHVDCMPVIWDFLHISNWFTRY